MGEGDPLYRAAHLGLEQWNDISADSRIRPSYHDHADEKRRAVYSKIISYLLNFMSEHLTARQYDVIRMYHWDYDLTQNAIGRVLGIAQPTVNQHLNGKRRGGKRIGGAYHRIRRELGRIATNESLPEEERRIVRFLLSLGQSNIRSKKRRRLFLSLQ